MVGLYRKLLHERCVSVPTEEMKWYMVGGHGKNRLFGVSVFGSEVDIFFCRKPRFILPCVYLGVLHRSRERTGRRFLWKYTVEMV